MCNLLISIFSTLSAWRHFCELCLILTFVFLQTLEKSRSLFFKEYCQRLTLSLLVLSITIPAVGHTLKFTLLKYGGYIMLIFSLYFEMHTRIYGSSELLHNSPSFQIAVAAWEIIVGNILVLNRQVLQVLFI